MQTASTNEPDTPYFPSWKEGQRNIAKTFQPHGIQSLKELG